MIFKPEQIKIILFAICISAITSCGFNIRSLDGNYVYVEDIYGEYYTFDKKSDSFTYYDSYKVADGKVYNDKNTFFMKSDSIYYYKNVTIQYHARGANVDDKGVVRIEEEAFQQFEKKHPALSLFFIGFNHFSRKKPAVILELKSGDNLFSMAGQSYVDSFKLIGLQNKCYPTQNIYHCKLFDKTFETNMNLLGYAGFGVEIDIDLDKVLKLNLSQERNVRVIDSFDGKNKFYSNGKLYEKIKRLQ
jgi:hypothetical protein